MRQYGRLIDISGPLVCHRKAGLHLYLDSPPPCLRLFISPCNSTPENGLLRPLSSNIFFPLILLLLFFQLFRVVECYDTSFPLSRSLRGEPPCCSIGQSQRKRSSAICQPSFSFEQPDVSVELFLDLFQSC